MAFGLLVVADVHFDTDRSQIATQTRLEVQTLGFIGASLP
jgi:hypothetical protein